MIILILLIGLALSLINLNQSLWLDEAISALAIRDNTFLGLIFSYAPGDFHPPLYYLFLKLWSTVFGYSEIALRIPSLLFFLGTGAFVYLIAKNYASKKISLIATLLWVVNPLAVYYAQEARMYSLATFAVTAAVWFFLQKKWLWYFVFLIIALGSDYLPALMLPVFFLFSKAKKQFLIFHLSIFILFLLWSPIFIFQLFNGLSAATSSWGTILGRFDLKALPLTLVKFIIGRISLDNKLLYGAIMLPIAGEYLITALRSKSKLAWTWLLIPLVLGLLISIFIPIYSYFRLLFVLPALILLIALGVRQSPWKASFFIIVSLVSLAIFNLNSEFHRENWREAASYIQNDPGTVIFPNVSQGTALKYYAPGFTSLPKMKAGLADTDTVYLMRYVQEIFDPEDYARTALENRGYQRVEERGFNGVLIWKYQR